MACLLSAREVEELEEEEPSSLPVGAFARPRPLRDPRREALDKSETDVLPKGYLFVLLLVVLFAGVLPASFVLWACLSVFFVSTCARLSAIERQQQRAAEAAAAAAAEAAAAAAAGASPPATTTADSVVVDIEAPAPHPLLQRIDVPHTTTTNPLLLTTPTTLDDAPPSAPLPIPPPPPSAAAPPPPPAAAAAAELLQLALAARELTPRDYEALLALDAVAAALRGGGGGAEAGAAAAGAPLRPNSGAERFLGAGAGLARAVSETDLARLPTHIWSEEEGEEQGGDDAPSAERRRRRRARGDSGVSSSCSSSSPSQPPSSHSDKKPHACAVCLEPYRKGDAVTTLPCLHRFHGGCVSPWLRQQGAAAAACPLCKTAVWV